MTARSLSEAAVPSAFRGPRYPAGVRRPLLAAALVALVALPAPAAPDGERAPDPYDRILAQHREKLRTNDVLRAIDAVKLLDPENPRSMPEYLGLLAKWHWRVRGAAMESLAQVKSPSLRAEMRLHVVAHEDPWVREGMAFAITIAPVPGDGEALVAAMDDRDFRVRRTVARGLGAIVSREGVGRLVRALNEEKDLRVLVWVRASLRSVVGEDLGFDPGPWNAWWERNRERPEFRTHAEEVVRSDFKGVPLERMTYDVPPGSDAERAAREKRPDLFVLAPFGWSHDWFRPYLDEAGRFLRIVYVTLPTVREVTGASGYGPSIPEYPVVRLATALDALREAQRKESVLLLAAGPVGWIAETYALKYPGRTAGLVIVDSWLDAQAYVESLGRLGRGGDSHERWAAQTLTGPGQRDATELRELRSTFLTSSLRDRRDSEAFRLWRSAGRDHGFASVPPLVFDRHLRISTPTLFMFPDPDVQLGSGGGPDDLRRIRDSFKDPPPVTAVLRETRGFALQEDPAEFLRVLRGFLEFAGVTR
jgi:pimeloyl-ACP methyl ester carboxylesterase